MAINQPMQVGLGAVAAQAKQSTDALSDRVFEAVCANDYDQFGRLIGMMAQAQRPQGLHRLRTAFEKMAVDHPKYAASGERQIIGISMRGPIDHNSYARNRDARLVRAALMEIADALGDVDGFADQYSDEERTDPAIAAAIAERMLLDERAEDARVELEKAASAFR